MTEPAAFASRLGTGLLSFPVTHFTDELAFDEPAYRDHLSWLSGHDVAGLFAAGGTGEGFSLTVPEVGRVVRAAVDEIAGRTLVIAPALGPTAASVELARDAEAAGADGVLLFPPYLTEAGQRGLVEHVAAVCAATRLGVVVYNRANGVLRDTSVAELAERCPNLVGLKDGVGDIELMTRIVARLGDRLTYVGGLPTAELYALPYLQLGVTTYSSALFNFVPDFALGFYADVRAGDVGAVYRRLRDFVLPYSDLRSLEKGYAVSIIKAGLAAVGRPGSPVRPPLAPLRPTEQATLAELVATLS